MRNWVVFLLTMAALGCTPPAPPLPAPDHVYTTRGRIERLQDRTDDHVRILHEAIPEFVGVDGAVTGMGSMTMPFTIAEGVSLAGAGPGSKVAFTFESRWAGPVPLLVTSLKLLPAQTELTLAK